MKEFRGTAMKSKEKNVVSPKLMDSEAVSETRRDFIKKYGALAAVTPVALTLTMQSNKALASSVCTECGP